MPFGPLNAPATFEHLRNECSGVWSTLLIARLHIKTSKAKSCNHRSTQSEGVSKGMLTLEMSVAKLLMIRCVIRVSVMCIS